LHHIEGMPSYNKYSNFFNVFKFVCGGVNFRGNDFILIYNILKTCHKWVCNIVSYKVNVKDLTDALGYRYVA